MISTPDQLRTIAQRGNHEEICAFLCSNGKNPGLIGTLVEHLQKPAERGAKAWEIEPDHVIFERRDYFCMVYRLKGGQLGGYFGVPKGNPFFEEEPDVYRFFRASSSLARGVCGFRSSKLAIDLLPETHYYFAFDYGHLGDFSPYYDQLEREEKSFDPDRIKPVDLIAELNETIGSMRPFHPDLPMLPTVKLEDSGMLIYVDVTHALLALKEMCDRMDVIVRLFAEHPELRQLKQQYRYAQFGPFTARDFLTFSMTMYGEINATLPREQRYTPGSEELFAALANARFMAHGWDYEKAKRDLPRLEKQIEPYLDLVLPKQD